MENKYYLRTAFSFYVHAGCISICTQYLFSSGIWQLSAASLIYNNMVLHKPTDGNVLLHIVIKQR